MAGRNRNRKIGGMLQKTVLKLFLIKAKSILLKLKAWVFPDKCTVWSCWIRMGMFYAGQLSGVIRELRKNASRLRKLSEQNG